MTLYCTSLDAELPHTVRVVETLSVAGRRVPHRALGRRAQLPLPRSPRRDRAPTAGVTDRRRALLAACHASGRPALPAHAAFRASARFRTPTRRMPSRSSPTRRRRSVCRRRAGIRTPSTPTRSRGRNASTSRASGLLVPSEYSLRTFVERGIPRREADPPPIRLRAATGSSRSGAPRTRRLAQGDLRRPVRAAERVFTMRFEPGWTRGLLTPAVASSICGSFEPGYRELLEPLLAHPERRGGRFRRGSLRRSCVRATS